MAGRIVLSIGSHRTPDAEALAHLTTAEQEETVDRLAALHRHKIDLADEVLVINVGGDSGQSTRAEIAYAQRQGKRVRSLEDSRSDF